MFALTFFEIKRVENLNLGCCEVAFALQNVRPSNAERVLDHDHGLSFRGRRVEDVALRLTMCYFHNFGLIFARQCTVCLKG